MENYKAGGEKGNSNLFATNRLFKKSPLFRKRKKKAPGVYDPKAKYRFDKGGEKNNYNDGNQPCNPGYKWDEELQACIRDFEEVKVTPEDESWWNRMTRKVGKTILDTKVNKNNKNKEKTFDEFRRDTELSNMYDVTDWATKPKESKPKKIKKPSKQEAAAQKLFNRKFRVLTAVEIAQKKLADDLAYNKALVDEPKYADEALDFVKGWHDSPMYKQMILNSLDGNQVHADYVTELRKENIANIPPINIMATSGTSAYGFKPSATSNSETGEVKVYPEGFGWGPSMYTHEYFHSSDRPRGIYNLDLINIKDPRFPDDKKLQNRVIPESDQMYITRNRGSNWKDNQEYKTRIEKFPDSNSMTNDEEIKQILYSEGFTEDDKDFQQKFTNLKNIIQTNHKEIIEDKQKEWKIKGHDYISQPTEVRARLGEVRHQARKEGIYDPFIKQITPEIFQNYINKKRSNKNWTNSMGPIQDLRKQFTDEEILWMLQNISKNNEGEEEIKVAARGGALLTKKVTCKKCGWKWDAADGGDDITTCHKCGGKGLVHAKNGGLNKFVNGGGKPCPKGMGWSIKDNKCIKLINFTAIKNRVDNITYKPLTKLEDALDDRYKKGPKNSFSDFGKLSTEEKIKLKADNLAYQAQVDAEAARQAANAQAVSTGSAYPYGINNINTAFLNPVGDVDNRIAAANKKGMMYLSTQKELKELHAEKNKIIQEQITRKKVEGLQALKDAFNATNKSDNTNIVRPTLKPLKFNNDLIDSKGREQALNKETERILASGQGMFGVKDLFDAKYNTSSLRELIKQQLSADPQAFYKKMQNASYQDFVNREQKQFDNLNWLEVGLNELGNFAADPIHTGATWLGGSRTGVQQGKHVRDVTDPDYNNWQRMTGYNDNWLNSSFNVINPLASSADAAVSFSQGDVLGFTGNTAGAFLKSKILTQGLNATSRELSDVLNKEILGAKYLTGTNILRAGSAYKGVTEYIPNIYGDAKRIASGQGTWGDLGSGIYNLIKLGAAGLPFTKFNDAALYPKIANLKNTFGFVDSGVNAAGGNIVDYSKALDKVNKVGDAAKPLVFSTALRFSKLRKEGGELNKYEEEGIVLDLSPEEIEEYRKGGYVIEDISVPSLSHRDEGGAINKFVDGGENDKDKKKRKWLRGTKKGLYVSEDDPNVQRYNYLEGLDMTAEEFSEKYPGYSSTLQYIPEIKITGKKQSYWDRMMKNMGQKKLNNKIKEKTFDEFRRDTELGLNDVFNWAAEPKKSKPRKPTKEETAAQKLFDEKFRVLTPSEILINQKLKDNGLHANAFKMGSGNRTFPIFNSKGEYASPEAQTYVEKKKKSDEEIRGWAELRRQQMRNWGDSPLGGFHPEVYALAPGGLLNASAEVLTGLSEFMAPYLATEIGASGATIGNALTAYGIGKAGTNATGNIIEGNYWDAGYDAAKGLLTALPLTKFGNASLYPELNNWRSALSFGTSGIDASLAPSLFNDFNAIRKAPNSYVSPISVPSSSPSVFSTVVGKLKKQKGGAIEKNMSKSEIKKLIAQGYVIEEI